MSRRAVTVLVPVLAALAFFGPLGCEEHDGGLWGTLPLGGGGGGGSGEFVRVSMDGGSPDVLGGPSAFASYEITMSPPFMLVGAGDLFGAGRAAGVGFWGDTPGPYDVALDEAAVLYQDAGGQTYETVAGIDTGAVTVTAVGAVGERVEGSFSVSAQELDDVTGQPTGVTVTMDGSFSVIREQDDFFPALP